ncbi:C40 family peptidase [Geomicrobium sp. JCM 19039]|uniref:C40 family peptidase n=1 Tax=Geomicrobium sp. JCM 19039 TaxID=1460636 RepID=UPI0006946AC3|nr:NlpC/P60 family protein [Geomicrobium sp. JCM 19039]
MRYTRLTKFVVTTSFAASLFAFSPSMFTETASASAPAGDTAAVETVAVEASATGIVQIGDRGQSVVDLQSALQDSGHSHVNADGIFGPITEEAVRSFQQAQGLSVDGIAGPNTFQALTGRSEVKSVSTETSTSTESSTSGVIGTAQGLIGTPYSWGGTTPAGFDCSGFLNYVFAQNGQSLPRTTQAIYDAGTPVSAPAVGDLVFFQGTYNTSNTATHAGIYIGGNEFIHASSSGVRIDNLSSNYYQTIS